MLPLLAVIVSELLNPFIEEFVGTDSVVDPEPVTVVGLNEPVAPDTLKLTVPVNPLRPATLTV